MDRQEIVRVLEAQKRTIERNNAAAIGEAELDRSIERLRKEIRSLGFNPQA